MEVDASGLIVVLVSMATRGAAVRQVGVHYYHTKSMETAAIGR